MTPRGVGHIQRGVGAVRAGRKGGIGQNGMAAKIANDVGDLLIATGDDNGTDIRLQSSPPDMRNHRLAIDIRKRLARKPA